MFIVSLVFGLIGPLILALLAGRIAKLPRDNQLWLRFSAGAATAFVALIAEQYAFQYFRPWMPSAHLVPIEAFLFVGLPEETAKLALIYGAMVPSSNVDFRSVALVGLAVGAGFAGAENVVYVLHANSNISELLTGRMLTAVPFHLSNAVVSTFLLCKARSRTGGPVYVVTALIVAVSLHSFYDYLIMTNSVHEGRFFFPLLLTVGIAWRLLANARDSASVPRA